MTPQTDSRRSLPTRHEPRTVAVVSRRPNQRVLDAVDDYDVVLIESVAQAYSHIRRLKPQMVIVCLEIDDVEGAQVLSMLHLDSATSRIPVVTYLVPPEEDEEDCDEEDRELGARS